MGRGKGGRKPRIIHVVATIRQASPLMSGSGSIVAVPGDIYPPGTPTLTVGTVTSSSIALSCNAVTDPGIVSSGVSTYKFEGKLTSLQDIPANWTTIQNTSSRTATYSGLTANTSYDVRVSAIDASGNQSAFDTTTRTTATSAATLLWYDGFDTGYYRAATPTATHGFELVENYQRPRLYDMPTYGRPVTPSPTDPYASTYGNGDLMALTDGAAFGVPGKTINRVTVKDSTAAQDWPEKSTRRRTELFAMDEAKLAKFSYMMQTENGVPGIGGFFFSISHFFPANWNVQGLGNDDITIFQLKAPDHDSNSANPTVSITLQRAKSVFQFRHGWYASTVSQPTDAAHQMFYTPNYDGQPYPRSNFWPEGLTDIPDATTTWASMSDMNLGGWTDWVFRARWDARGSLTGGAIERYGTTLGVGYLDVWKRARSPGDNVWRYLFAIRPKSFTRQGATYDHGIGHPLVGNTGWTYKVGMYGSGSNDPPSLWIGHGDTTIYHYNMKIARESSGFASVSPDGSVPAYVPPVGQQ